jgi:uncharacterized protein YeaO (DUF488 family)
MALKLRTFRIGQPPKRGEGIRLGVVRFLPRGVKKEYYRQRGFFDLWFPALAPSQALLKKRDAGLLQRYRSELLSSSESRQTLLFLAEVAKKTPLAIGCYCSDESRCHRSVLASLIREAAGGSLPAR